MPGSDFPGGHVSGKAVGREGGFVVVCDCTNSNLLLIINSVVEG